MKSGFFFTLALIFVCFDCIFTTNALAQIPGGINPQIENNKLIANKLVECFNKKDLNIVDEIFADSLILNGHLISRSDIKQAVTWWISRFPDLKVTAAPTIVENEKIGFWYKAEGTQQGEFNGIRPTNKYVTWNGFDLLRIVNNRIIEGWFVADRLGLAQKLGAKLQMTDAEKN